MQNADTYNPRNWRLKHRLENLPRNYVRGVREALPWTRQKFDNIVSGRQDSISLADTIMLRDQLGITLEQLVDPEYVFTDVLKKMCG